MCVHLITIVTLHFESQVWVPEISGNVNYITKCRILSRGSQHFGLQVPVNPGQKLLRYSVPAIFLLCTPENKMDADFD